MKLSSLSLSVSMALQEAAFFGGGGDEGGELGLIVMEPMPIGPPPTMEIWDDSSSNSLVAAHDDVLYQADKKGKWQSISADKPAIAKGRKSAGIWYADGDGDGEVTAWFVREAPHENLLSESKDLTGWTLTGSCTAAFTQTGMTDEANDATLLTDPGASYSTAYKEVAITADSNTVSARVFIAREAVANQSFFGVYLLLSGGTSKQEGCVVDSFSGAYTYMAGYTGGSYYVDASDPEWIEVVVDVANNSTNTVARLVVVPAHNFTLNPNLTTSASGAVTAGYAEIVPNKAKYEIAGTSPAFNTGGSKSLSGLPYISINAAKRDDNQGVIYLKWTSPAASSDLSGDVNILTYGTTAGLLYYDGAAGALKSTDGTNTASFSLTLERNREYVIALAYGSGSMAISVDGVWGTAATYDGDFPGSGNLLVGYDSPFVQKVRDVQVWDTAYTVSKDRVNVLEEALHFKGLHYRLRDYELVPIVTGSGEPTFEWGGRRWFPNRYGSFTPANDYNMPIAGARAVRNFIQGSMDLGTPASTTQTGVFYNPAQMTFTGGVADPQGGETAFLAHSIGALSQTTTYQQTGLTIDDTKTMVASCWFMDVNLTNKLDYFEPDGTTIDVRAYISPTDWTRIALESLGKSSYEHECSIRFWNSSNDANVYLPQFEIPESLGESYDVGEPVPTYAGYPFGACRHFACESGYSVGSLVVTEGQGAVLDDPGWFVMCEGIVNLFNRPYEAVYWSTIAGTPPIQACEWLDGTGFYYYSYGMGDDQAGITEGKYLTYSISADTQTSCCRAIVRKDSELSVFALLQMSMTGGTSQNRAIWLNTVTGSYNESTGSADGKVEVHDLGEYLEVLFELTNNGGNTAARLNIYPAYALYMGGAEDVTATRTQLQVVIAEFHFGKTLAQIRRTGATHWYNAANPVDGFGNVEYAVANYNDSGLLFLEWKPWISVEEMTQDQSLIALDDTKGLLYYDYFSKQLRSNDGTNIAAVDLVVRYGREYKIALAYSDDKMQIGVNGVWGELVDFDGSHVGIATLNVGHDLEGTHYLRNLRVAELGFGDAIKQAVTLMSRYDYSDSLLAYWFGHDKDMKALPKVLGQMAWTCDISGEYLPRQDTFWYADDSDALLPLAFGRVVDSVQYVDGKGDRNPTAKYWSYPAKTGQMARTTDLTLLTTRVGTGAQYINAFGMRDGTDNTASSLTDSGSNSTYWYRTGTVVDDSNPVTVRLWVEKEKAGYAYGRIDLQLTGGTAVAAYAVFSLREAYLIQGDVNSKATIHDRGRYLEILMEVYNNGSGNTGYDARVYSSYNIDGSLSVSLSATGSIIVAAWELYYDQICDVRGSAIGFLEGTTGVAIPGTDSTQALLGDIPVDEGLIQILWTPQFFEDEVPTGRTCRILTLNAGDDLLYYDKDNAQIRSYDGTNTASIDFHPEADREYLISLAYGSSKMRLAVDDMMGAEATFDNAFAYSSYVQVGDNGPGGSFHYRDLKVAAMTYDEGIAIMGKIRPAGLIQYDDFEGVDDTLISARTPNVGDYWIEGGWEFKILGGELEKYADHSRTRGCLICPCPPDNVRAEALITTADTNLECGPMVRAYIANGQPYGYVAFYETSAPSLRIYRLNGSSPTLRANKTIPAQTAPFVISLETKGTRLIARLNGHRVEYDESNYVGSKGAGVHMYASSTPRPDWVRVFDTTEERIHSSPVVDLPGTLIFKDSFQGYPLGGTTLNSARTPDYDLVGNGWVNMNLGAFGTAHHKAHEPGVMTPTSANACHSGSHCDCLVKAMYFELGIPGQDFGGGRTQIHVEKIGSNGWARVLDLYFQGPSSLEVHWGLGGSSSAPTASWDPTDGAWTISRDDVAGQDVPIKIVMDRTADTVDVTIGDVTKTFELKTDVYTQFDGSADYWGFYSITGPFRAIKNLWVTSE